MRNDHSRTPAYRPTRIAFILLVMSTLLASTASAQMMIEEISITSGPAYSVGSFTDFFIDPNVMGFGISSVTVTSQFGGFSRELTEVTPGEFNCDEPLPSPCEEIASLADISALGALTFTFVGDLPMEMDSFTVPLVDYDPGAGQSGFPGVVFPDHLATGVAIDATLEWTTPPSWVQAVEVSIEDLATGATPDEMTFFGDPIFSPVTDTMWAPDNMVANASYLFELSFFEAIAFAEPRMTTGGQNFDYTGAFESFNESVFTVPEPGVIALNAVALLTVLGIGRRRGRSVG